MNRRKSLVVSIIFVLLLIVVVASSTYAYITAMTREGTASTGSGILDINYTAPGDITGVLVPSVDRSSGLFTSASASVKEGSEVAYLNMYITPTALTNLNIEALKWEAEGLRDVNNDGTLDTVCSYNGNFSNAEVDTAIKVVDGCRLDYTDTTFNIYIWLDANTLNTSLSGASFGAKIGADSVDITGTY